MTTEQPTDEQTFQPAVQNWVNQAKEDLAQRRAISTTEIGLLSFKTKVWSEKRNFFPTSIVIYW